VGERCPVCHGEERSDEAIHLEFQLDCRARPAGLAMTNPRVNYARSGADIARQGTAYFSGAPTWAGKPMLRGTGFPAREFEAVAGTPGDAPQFVETQAARVWVIVE